MYSRHPGQKTHTAVLNLLYNLQATLQCYFGWGYNTFSKHTLAQSVQLTLVNSLAKLPSCKAQMGQIMNSNMQH